MSVVTRARRNISRRKARALLVIVALSFSMAIMISIPAGVLANQKATEDLTENLSKTIAQTEASINQTQKQIDCNLDPSLAGFGFESVYIETPLAYQGGREWQWEWLLENLLEEWPEETDLASELYGVSGMVPMKQDFYWRIAEIPGVAAVAPTLQKIEGRTETDVVFNRKFTRLVPDYIIEGIPLTSDLIDNHPVLPANISAGRNLQEGDSGVVLLSEGNAAFFQAGVGDAITILGKEFVVIGVHETSGVSGELTLYMELSDAQRITDNIGQITSIRVFTESSDVVTEVTSTINSIHPELITKTAQQRLQQLEALKQSYSTTLQNAKNSFNQTQAAAMKEIFVVTSGTSLIVLFVMLYTVRERTKEIGTLKAIGFSKGNVMKQFVIEGTMLSLIAGAVGIAIGIVAAPFLSSFLLPNLSMEGSSTTSVVSTGTVMLDPQLMLLAFGAAILLGALGSLYPAWRASRTRPAEAMRYE